MDRSFVVGILSAGYSRAGRGGALSSDVQPAGSGGDDPRNGKRSVGKRQNADNNRL